MINDADCKNVARFFENRRQEIIAEWMAEVRNDRKIPSADELASSELLDHLPVLLDELIKNLSIAHSEGNISTERSEVHGEIRWRQGYRLDELLQEITILRKVLMGHLTEFYGSDASEKNTRLLSLNVINNGLDSIAAKSTKAFVEQQQEEIQKANDSLTSLNVQIQNFNELLVLRDDRRLRTIQTIAHEITNYLNMMNLVVIILQKDPDQKTIAAHMESLSKSISSMNTLTKHLMEFATLASEGESPRLTPVEPRWLFDELSMFGQNLTAPKGLAFIPHFDSTLQSVITDQSQLQRICMNLLTNAAKYTEQGEIRFSFAMQDNQTWKIEISDTGCGISENEQKKIFEEFYRSNHHRQTHAGVGLGLAITEQLAQLLGGKIELESAVGKGSTFRVLLPVQPRSAK